MKKKRKRKKLLLDVSPQVAKAIKTLHRTGLFGLSIEQVAERLICRELERPDVAPWWSERHAHLIPPRAPR